LQDSSNNDIGTILIQVKISNAKLETKSLAHTRKQSSFEFDDTDERIGIIKHVPKKFNCHKSKRIEKFPCSNYSFYKGKSNNVEDKDKLNKNVEILMTQGDEKESYNISNDCKYSNNLKSKNYNNSYRNLKSLKTIDEDKNSDYVDYRIETTISSPKNKDIFIKPRVVNILKYDKSPILEVDPECKESSFIDLKEISVKQKINKPKIKPAVTNVNLQKSAANFLKKINIQRYKNSSELKSNLWISPRFKNSSNKENLVPVSSINNSKNNKKINGNFNHIISSLQR